MECGADGVPENSRKCSPLATLGVDDGSPGMRTYGRGTEAHWNANAVAVLFLATGRAVTTPHRGLSSFAVYLLEQSMRRLSSLLLSPPVCHPVSRYLELTRQWTETGTRNTYTRK